MSKTIDTELLTTSEEYDAIMRFQNPHLLFFQEDILSQKNIAQLVLGKKEDEILLLSPEAFLSSSVFAGISEKQIEYIAKNAPEDYKTRIRNLVNDSDFLAHALEICNYLDQDREKESTDNMDRLKNVTRYINDNLSVFEFD